MELIQIFWIFMVVNMFCALVCITCMISSHKNAMQVILGKPIDNRGLFQQFLNGVGIKKKATYPDQSEERKLQGLNEGFNYDID